MPPPHRGPGRGPKPRPPRAAPPAPGPGGTSASAGQSLLDPAVTQRVLERIRNGVEQPHELRNLSDQEKKILEFWSSSRRA